MAVKSWVEHFRRKDDPSPQEIAERCALIRQEWSQAEFYIRGGANPPGWLAGTVSNVTPLRWTAPQVKAGFAQ